MTRGASANIITSRQAFQTMGNSKGGRPLSTDIDNDGLVHSTRDTRVMGRRVRQSSKEEEAVSKLEPTPGYRRVRELMEVVREP